MKIMYKTAIYILLSSLFISGCTVLPSQIQVGNLTKDPADNKWDYYDGSSVHYTSFIRTKFQEQNIVINENTDSFSVVVTAPKNNNHAYLTMNGLTIKMNQIDDEEIINKILIKRYGRNTDLKPLKGWDRWYLSDDQRFHLAVNHNKNIVYTGISSDSEQHDVAYYPSRYLACKKLWAINSENNSLIIRELLKTALVAGVQSYTSYATTSYYSSYGNFGYSQTRDYSWAGARAGDALSTLFAGEYSGSKVASTWKELNCY